MKSDLFVYYRAQPADAAAVEAAVGRLRTALAHPVSLHRRPETRDGLHTWMEIYRDIPADFDALLSDAVHAAGLTGLIVGERHREVFLEVSPCA